MKFIVGILKGIWMAVRIGCPIGLGLFVYNRGGTAVEICGVITGAVWFLWVAPCLGGGSILTDMEDGE